MIINLNIGLITPPLGVSLFAAERIANCGLNAVIKESLPFIAINIAALALIALVPQISLFLPRLVGESGIRVMKGIKNAFDPKGILNPGKVF